MKHGAVMVLAQPPCGLFEYYRRDHRDAAHPRDGLACAYPFRSRNAPEALPRQIPLTQCVSGKLMQNPGGQQGCPRRPQGSHMPATQIVSPAVQVLPAQHAAPMNPQGSVVVVLAAVNVSRSVSMSCWIALPASWSSVRVPSLI